MNSKQWWKSGKQSVLNDLIADVSRLREYREGMGSIIRQFMSLYNGYEVTSELPGKHRSFGAINQEVAKYNIVASMVDTAQALITKTTPTIKFLTQGATSPASYSQKRRCMRLNDTINTLIQDHDMYSRWQEIFKDACITGTAGLYVRGTRDGIAISHIKPSQIIVDEPACFQDRPRVLYTVRVESIDTLNYLYPTKTSYIEMANGSFLFDTFEIEPALGGNSFNGMCAVLEAWRLPTGDTPGRHVVAIPGRVLEDEEYMRQHFPISLFKYKTRAAGFWGMGIAEQLKNIQYDIDDCLFKMTQITRDMGKAYIFISDASNVKPEHFNDLPGVAIIKTNTSAGVPVVKTFDETPSSLVEMLERHIDKAYRTLGFSELQASARKEPGITAGVAMQEMSDLQSNRFSITQQSYETFIKESCINLLDAAYDSMKMGADVRVVASLEDLDLSELPPRISINKANSLASTPAGRKQQALDLFNAGLITPEDTLEVMGFEDLASVVERNSVDKDAIARMIELAVDERVEDKDYEPVYPTSEWNLQLTSEMLRLAKMHALKDNAPPNIMKRLNDISFVVNRYLSEQQAQAQLEAQQAQMPAQ
jgi:hypothetical protein